MPHNGDTSAPSRRVLIGVDKNNRSTVIDDTRDLPSTVLPNGIRIEEVWQQREIPANVNSVPSSDWALGPDAPSKGAVVRILSLPPSGNQPEAEIDLHTDEALHVFTVLNGELTVILEEGESALSPGDSLVLRGSIHDLRNEQPETTRFVYTSFPLTR